jgi:hypothetical protein
MQRRTFVFVGLCGLLLLGAAPVAAAQSSGTGASLVGSWEFTLKPNPGPTSTPVTEGLATFTSDLTVIETDTDEIVTHLTPGHGIWQPSPVFGSWFIRFTSLGANLDGTLRSKRIVTMTVALNSTHHQFSGGYSFEVDDASGHAIATGSGTVTGRLMPHPLLP